MQETAVGSCNILQIREVAKTTERQVVTNFFQNVFFKTWPFNICSSKMCLFNCSWKLQQNAVGSCDTLQSQSAVESWCKLRNEFATNWGCKLHQTSNGSCNNLRTAVGSCYEYLRLEVAIICGRKLQQSASGKLQQTVNVPCNKALIALVSCNELRLEFATNCGYNRHELRTAAVGSWSCNAQQLEMATNCEWKLQQQQTTDCGWKWEETLFERCKCSKLRWEVARNCKWWKLQQTTKRVFNNVSFQNVFFQYVFFQNVFVQRQLEVATNCGWKLQHT